MFSGTGPYPKAVTPNGTSLYEPVCLLSLIMGYYNNNNKFKYMFWTAFVFILCIVLIIISFPYVPYVVTLQHCAIVKFNKKEIGNLSLFSCTVNLLFVLVYIFRDKLTVFCF